MDKPFISILLPTYEPNPTHLREALHRLVAQTEKRWTLCIRDDASTVDVRSMLEPYLQDPRVRFERGEKRLGIGGNWNACLGIAEGAYVQYLFQDDLWEPTYLERAAAMLEQNPTAPFVAVGHRYVFEGEGADRDGYDEVLRARKDTLTPGIHEGKAFVLSWLERGLRPNLIGEPSFVMMRKEATTKAGPFLEDMPQFLDVEYWTRLLLLGDLAVITDDLGTFRVHPKGASAQNQREGKGLFDRLRCIERVINKLHGDEKRRGERAFGKILEEMIRKFLGRRKSGKQISYQGGGSLKTIALRHPILLTKALLRALSKPETQEIL